MTTMAPDFIPPANPGAGVTRHNAAIRAAIDRVLTSGWFVLGEENRCFEAEFSAFHGGGEMVGVANGTDAIELALRAIGVQPGDHIATVSFTVTATVAAITSIGAVPVFVEIDEDTMTMSPIALAGVLDRCAIKAILPVHLYGHPADMSAIMAIADEHSIPVIEDCAQAHGARCGGRLVGTFGAAAAFSFYPTKNLGGIGDGGAVLTRDPLIAERVRSLRQYGWKTRYIAEITGRNSRLDELQAAILRTRLPHLEAENARRREHAAAYTASWATLGVTLPSRAQDAEAVFHQYALRHPRRDALQTALAAHGVGCAVLYPVPVHQQPAHATPDVSLPITEKAAREVLCVPVYPELSDEQRARIVAALPAALLALGD